MTLTKGQKAAQKAWKTRRRNQAQTATPTPQSDIDLLTLGEVANALGISYPTLHTRLDEITPAPKKLGKRYFFTSADLPALEDFFNQSSPPDSPAKRAWVTRRSNANGNDNKSESGAVLTAYLAAQQPGATAGVKARATRLMNNLADRRALEGKNPNMVRAGIKAQASRIIGKGK